MTHTARRIGALLALPAAALATIAVLHAPAGDTGTQADSVWRVQVDPAPEPTPEPDDSVWAAPRDSVW